MAARHVVLVLMMAALVGCSRLEASLRHAVRGKAAKPATFELSGDSCFGLPKKMCMSCGGGPQAKGFPGGPICKAMAERCENSFCTDICLSDTVWRCSASWKDKADDAGARTNGPLTEAEKRALCAQTKALACSSMKCCATSEDTKGSPLDAGSVKEGVMDPLREWVVAQESLAVQSAQPSKGKAGLGGGVDAGALMLPVPALPLQRCEHDPADRMTADFLCKTCQGRLRLELTDVKDPALCSALGPTSADFSPFTQDDAEPSQKSLYDRCKAAAPEMVGALAGGDVKSWQTERLCRCAGCCSDPPDSKSNALAFAAADCPFPGYALAL